MKRFLYFVLLLGVSQTLYSQTGLVDSSFKVKFGGFFKYDCWFDTRKNAEALDALFLMYPEKKLLDANGKDINAESSINMAAITSRVNTSISGPVIFKAQTGAFIEVDFSGISNEIFHTRFRHAYTYLKWKKSKLLLGNYWHPLFVDDVFPTVLSLNTGVPFQVFNRSPQINYTYKLGMFEINTAMVYQADYKSIGPAGKSTTYIRDAKMPNLHGQLRFVNKSVTLGAAFDYKKLKPRPYTISLTDGKTMYKSDVTIDNSVFMIYSKYKSDKFEVKAKAMQGQNMVEHVLPGAFAEVSIDSVTGKASYTSFSHRYLWGNILYGNSLKFGVFGGYLKNLGASRNISGAIYGRGADIDAVYRISPSITLKKRNLLMGLELEHTIADYGVNDCMNNGKVKEIYTVSNTRVLFSMLYFFN